MMVINDNDNENSSNNGIKYAHYRYMLYQLNIIIAEAQKYITVS